MADSAIDWHSANLSMLALYHLHYFDDLNAEGADGRAEWHRALVERWVHENPPGQGIGWDPYPTSRRIVNWVKWALRGNHLEAAWRDSLATQARWLRRRLEYHLLANHLFANAKALVFAGLFFEGDEAAGWLRKGLEILEREVPEQVLADGGHFERSPMYHAIILEDLLDLVNLAGAYRPAESPGALDARLAKARAEWVQAAGRMLGWLGAMSHPDGGIAFFNDAAFGMAPSAEALADYARRLAIELPAAPAEGLTHLAESGYVRYQHGPLAALLDVAPVGPDYQPGHAHADTLSFELSLFGQRLFVNSGTSTYEVGDERHRQRSTRAHNTVEVNGENSSEVWKSFRVARRAYPRGLELGEAGEATVVRCAHDGYRRLRGRPEHRRTWRFENHGMHITDEITGRFRTAVVSFHLHPEVVVEQSQALGIVSLRLPGGQEAWFECDGGTVAVEESTWHPEFGMAIPSHVIRCGSEGPRLRCSLTWNAA